MNDALLWALNTLLQDLLTPLMANSAETTGTPFSDWLTNATPPSSATSSSPSTVSAAINAAAAATGLAPELLRAVAQTESDFNPEAVSSAGAVGVMQLMPGTAAGLGVNPYNVSQNVLGGAEYLKQLLADFHQNLPLALAAYNAGPGAVTQYHGIPPYAQTQAYVQKVLSVYQNSSTDA
ncbi:lytic transglycosylase [Sulfobacillus acidophilus TPY]|uniref:Lytic transglycosylase catalytic n=1 Tax=Sulfobacillus acidophilus (strain ATCC 700253 / DSM 10332 / NAL) TaxID=679936 RepID=G8U1H1_SULAD|nr:lytic transglycosylase [Sulfobacillus acidophilus TPY]AEW06576.1 Lytic transglycosylase catalytic [Sulfobacillus acidophilus DSM 10332]